MTEEQLLTEPQTEEGGFNPDDISEKIIDHIGIYENAFTSDECDELISKFNTSIDNSYTSDGKHQFDSCLLYTSPSPRD